MENQYNQDMSATCGFKDTAMYYKREIGEITEGEYFEYYDNNCGKCIYMWEICMCGEE